MAGTIKHEWNGTVLTITSDSGTSSADLKGEKGDDGARGPQGKACSVATDTTHLGGIAAAEYALKTDLPPITAYNLLDNSYFPAAFLINQRGETTYTGSNYSIDRWRAYHADTTHEITAEGVKVSSSGNNPNMYQVIERHKIDTNKTYTAAAMDAEGNIYLRVGTPTTTGYAYCCIYISGNNVLFRLNGAKTWVWAALYEGEYTENEVKKYFYKGYAAELLECQRYFFKSPIGGNIQGSGIVSSTLNEVLINVVVPVNMRITPSINIIANGSIRSGGTHQTVETLTVRGMSSNIVSLRAVVINNFPANNTAALVNASFELSADL